MLGFQKELKTGAACLRQLAALIGEGVHLVLCRWTRCGGLESICVCAVAVLVGSGVQSQSKLARSTGVGSGSIEANAV